MANFPVGYLPPGFFAPGYFPVEVLSNPPPLVAPLIPDGKGSFTELLSVAGNAPPFARE
jgi:hypothetical protein